MIEFDNYGIPISWPFSNSYRRDMFVDNVTEHTVCYINKQKKESAAIQFSHPVDCINYIKKEIEKNKLQLEKTTQGRFLLEGHQYLSKDALMFLLSNPAHDLHHYVTDKRSVKFICWLLSGEFRMAFDIPLYRFKLTLERRLDIPIKERFHQVILKKEYIKVPSHFYKDF